MTDSSKSFRGSIALPLEAMVITFDTDEIGDERYRLRVDLVVTMCVCGVGIVVKC